MPNILSPSRIRRHRGYVRIESDGRTATRNWMLCLLVGFVLVIATATIMYLNALPEEDLTETLPKGPLQSTAGWIPRRPANRSEHCDPDWNSTFPAITNEDVEAAYDRASQEQVDLRRRWPGHHENGSTWNESSSHADLFLKFYQADLSQRHFRTEVSEGDILQRTAAIIRDQYQLEPQHAGTRLRAHRIGQNNRHCLSKHPAQERHCNPRSRYRTYNGTCNNLREPLWGAAGTPYARGLPPVYADGLSTPRVSALDGSALPTARNISVEIHSSRAPVESPTFSALMTFWGQFVAHDVSKLEPNLRPLRCCAFPEYVSSADCLPIDISPADPFYSQFNVSCIGMGRSEPAPPRPDCVLGPREQVNLLTSYLDGSVVYGSSAQEADRLRSFQGGQLKTSYAVNNTFMPYFDTKTTACTQDDSDNFCFYAGDDRCNENIALVSLHTVFLREHNRLSAFLAELNPSWTDEKLYQEARRLVAAELQHVTYGQYLPLLVGSEVAAHFGLELLAHGYYSNYSKELDASIANEFAAAAFRFGHSAVSDRFLFADDVATRGMSLHEGLFASSLLTQDPESFARLVYGTSVQSAYHVDAYIAEQMTNHVFQTRHSEYGFDLNAISIQRGRDHGIADYNKFREYCGLPRLRTFEDLEHVLDLPLARRYAQLYKSVEDLDLHSVGLSEHALPGGQLGPTFTCLIGDQFARLRQGDRFWYENGPQSNPYPFTEEQLAQIRKVTLARIICDNVPNIRSLPPSVFLLQSDRNQPVPCAGDHIPRLDISFWVADKYHF